MSAPFILTLIASILISIVCSKTSRSIQEITTVHLVPHSHDDVGWLQTVDGYYFKTLTEEGKHNAVSRDGGVHFIITSVIDALLDNPERTFVWSEMKFLAMWWKLQSEKKKDQVRGLVRNGQLEFVNGGWSMHDEACPSYSEMIQNMIQGHAFVAEEFGQDIARKIKIGW